MNTWKVILATLVIFGAGFVTGAFLVKPSKSTRSVPPVVQPETTASSGSNAVRQARLPAPMPGPLRKDFLDRLNRELKISPTQRTQIEKIIADGQEQARTVWEQIEPDMHRIFTNTKNQIRAELTPEQKELFEDLLKRRWHKPSAVTQTNLPKPNP